ncbi:MAG: hypothetical protein LBL45_02360 [Treponema sp.]|nr:hypothetical protein [Treponema sp.]
MIQITNEEYNMDLTAHRPDMDLFGNSIKQKALTSMQRVTTRQSVLKGRDLYTTEPADIERFIKAIQRDGVELPAPIWEPAAGRGDISKTLVKYGHEVRSTDIFPYRDDDIDIAALDFFTCKNTAGDCKTIFTNPPFNAQEEFLEHALSFGVNVVFFARLSFLSSVRRRRIYERYNPAYVYVYSGRAHCYKDGDTSKGQNMIDYCVIMWKPPYKHETALRWIA